MTDARTESRDTRMIQRSPLLPFEQAGGALLPLIVAAMAFLACCALATAIGASRLASAWTDGLAGAATVRVSTAQPEAEARVAKALELLAETDGVETARALTIEEVGALLEPWFGARPPLEALPAPRIIAVTLDDDFPPDAAIMQARLDGARLGATYDDHGRWRARAANSAGAVRAVAIGALVMVALAMSAVVAFSVRASLAAQKSVIEALRLSGAEDRFIANMYQNRFLLLGAVGGVIGCLLALVMFWIFGASSSIEALLPDISSTGVWLRSAIPVILVGAGVATLAARISVLQTLRKGS